jgi:hypothetical protein
MSQIYSQASSVLVWLGRGGEDTLAAMQIQDNYAQEIFNLYADGKLTDADLESHKPDDPAYLLKYKLHVNMPNIWFAWNQFFRRCWFYRRWTLQETALTQQLDVWCGEHHFDWHKLKFLEKYFRLSGWRGYTKRFMEKDYPTWAFLPRRFVEDVSSNPEAWKKESLACYGMFNKGTVLTDILYRSCMLQCLDPRDMIYALLGVIGSTPQTDDAFEVPIDYDASVVDLYVSVLKVCVEKVPDLAILSMVQGYSKRKIEGLPAWAPDLHGIAESIMDKRLGLNRRQPESPLYNAAFRSPTVPLRRSVQANKLHLRGFRLGYIMSTCGIDPSTNGLTKGAATSLSSMLDICMSLPPILRDGQDRIQALWRTIVADSEIYPRPASNELGRCFHDWILKYLFFIRTSEVEWPSRLTTLCNSVTWLSDNTETLFPLPDVCVGSSWRGRLRAATSGNAFEEINKYIAIDKMHRFDAATSISARLLFRTDEGDLGYGPLSMRPGWSGDQVWVLENGRVPFVLRPVFDGKNFELLGECYVHGVMDGQLFSGGMPAYENISLV